MPKNRKLLGAAAFSLALAGGGAAGAILGTPSLTLAQDAQDPEDETPPSRAGRGHPRDRGGVQLEVAAEAIGITEDELRAALADGQSIRQVAEANGVDVQTVIDAMVAAATERLEAAIEALPERMAEVVEREGLPDRGPGHGRGGHFGAGLDAAAEAIGITSRGAADRAAGRLDHRRGRRGQRRRGPDGDRRARRRCGGAIDQAVANGRLTEERAAEIKANLPERFEAMVNGEGRFGGPPPRVAEPDTEGTNTAA